MVLLVIDVQKQLTTDELYNFDVFVKQVSELINQSRKNKVEVIYVKHDAGSGSKMTEGTEGFEIYEDFKPENNEKIFVKRVCSSFYETGLLEYLREKKEDTIMAVGLKTDYCIDATVKCGFEHGFRMILPAHANTTHENTYMTAETTYNYYNNFLWNERFAECFPFEKAIALINTCGKKKVK